MLPFLIVYRQHPEVPLFYSVLLLNNTLWLRNALLSSLLTVASLSEGGKKWKQQGVLSSDMTLGIATHSASMKQESEITGTIYAC